MTVFLIHIFATLFMTGLIWFVQVVHYKLFNMIGEDQFAKYEKLHMYLTTLVVAPAMLTEVISVMFLFYRAPFDILNEYFVISVVLLFIIWIATAVFQIPQHDILLKGFDEKAYRRLVRGNWVRTIAWTGRSICLFFLLHQLIGG